MEILLKQTPTSLYWLGFIFADGWFDFKTKGIGVHVSADDEDHLQLLCDYVESKMYTDKGANSGFNATTVFVRTQFRDKDSFEILVERFGLQPKKTYNPPTKLIRVLDTCSDDLFLSFMLGFFDGDGCIVSVPSQNSLTMRFQNHISWKFLLDFFEKRLYEVYPYHKTTTLTKELITRNGNHTAMLCLARYSLIEDIRNIGIRLELPLLTRKWEKVETFMEQRQIKMRDGQIKAKRNRRWLDSEIELLKANLDKPSSELVELFEGRTYNSINGKQNVLRRLFHSR